MHTFLPFLWIMSADKFAHLSIIVKLLSLSTAFLSRNAIKCIVMRRFGVGERQGMQRNSKGFRNTVFEINILFVF